MPEVLGQRLIIWSGQTLASLRRSQEAPIPQNPAITDEGPPHMCGGSIYGEADGSSRKRMGQVCCLSQCLFRKGESRSHPRQPFYAVSSLATATQHVSKRFGDARKKLAIEVEEA